MLGAPWLDAADRQRRLAGRWLGAWTRLPLETPYAVEPLLPGCELLSYGGGGRPLLIVAAPIKRHYLWDLLPEASAVRRLRELGFRVHLLRWTGAVVETGAGFGFFAADAPSAALRRLAEEGNGRPVLLAGHSLGGLFAAVAACLHPQGLAGLLLIETPLAFAAHRLGAAARSEALLRPWLRPHVPGTALGLLSAAMIPEEFVWRHWFDGVMASADPVRARLHAAVLRWTLDEFPLPERLVGDLLTILRTDAFTKGTLALGDRCLGPADLRTRVLAVSAGSPVAPPGSIAPFLDRCTRAEVERLPVRPELGTAFAHVSPLVGPNAQRTLWPAVADWAARD